MEGHSKQRAVAHTSSLRGAGALCPRNLSNGGVDAYPCVVHSAGNVHVLTGSLLGMSYLS